MGNFNTPGERHDCPQPWCDGSAPIPYYLTRGFSGLHQIRCEKCEHAWTMRMSIPVNRDGDDKVRPFEEEFDE